MSSKAQQSEATRRKLLRVGRDLFARGGYAAVATEEIVRLEDREALLVGDAIYHLDTLDHERRSQFLQDEHNWRRSLREIQLYRRENPNALIIPSHDYDVWAKLEEMYE